MLKLLQKLLGNLKTKSFVTADEKAEMKTLFSALTKDEQETVQPDVDEVEAKPETDPAAPESEEDEDEELAKSIKALVGTALKTEVAKMKVEMEDEIKAFIAEQKDLQAKKAGVYASEEVKATRAALNSRLQKTMLAMMQGDESELKKIGGFASHKELTTDDTGSPFGGYAVDRELSAEIRALITEYGVARREFTAIQLSKNSYDANTLVTDVTVYWVDEGAVIPSTQVVLGQESLDLKKLGAIVTLTSELIADSEIDLFQFIGTRVAEGFAQAEDAAFFMGDGSSNYGGFEGLTVVAGTVPATMDGATFADVNADDALGMQDLVPQSVANQGKYYGHRSVRNLFRKLKDEQGQYIYQDISVSGPATLWGRPFVEVEVMPSIADSDAGTPFLLYGDLKRAAILGYKGQIAAKRFDSGTVRNVANNADINLITTDREAIRWTERVGYIAIMPQMVAVLSTGSGS